MITSADIQNYLHVGEETVYKMVELGLLPKPVRSDGSNMFNLDELHRYFGHEVDFSQKTYTPGQVAKILKTRRDTVLKKIPYYKVRIGFRTRILITKGDIIKYGSSVTYKHRSYDRMFSYFIFNLIEELSDIWPNYFTYGERDKFASVVLNGIKPDEKAKKDGVHIYTVHKHIRQAMEKMMLMPKHIRSALASESKLRKENKILRQIASTSPIYNVMNDSIDVFNTRIRSGLKTAGVSTIGELWELMSRRKLVHIKGVGKSGTKQIIEYFKSL